MRIILASGSPRRRELLNLITEKFEVIVSNSEEILQEGLNIQEQSKQIAYQKAKTVFDEIQGDKIVIGSDTLVLKNGQHYGKPKTEKEAFEMISELQGDGHEVITSLCVLIKKDGKTTKYLDYDITKVWILPMAEEEIKEWIATGETMDKAGSYAIQGRFAKFIDKIEGNYNTVMGLPIQKLYPILKPYLEKK